MTENLTIYETRVPETLRELLEAEHTRLVRDGRHEEAVVLCFGAGWDQGYNDGWGASEETTEGASEGEHVCPDCAAQLEVAKGEAEQGADLI